MKLTYVAVFIVILMSAILLAGCTSTTSAPIATPTPQIVYVTVYVTPNPTEQVAPVATTTPTAVPTPVQSKTTTFQGTGDDVQSFTANGDGIRIFTMSYSGSGNFAIWLKDSQGNEIDLLANEIGSYSGKKSNRLGPGTYYLDVTASGPWSVTLTSM